MTLDGISSPRDPTKVILFGCCAIYDGRAIAALDTARQLSQHLQILTEGELLQKQTAGKILYSKAAKMKEWPIF